MPGQHAKHRQDALLTVRDIPRDSIGGVSGVILGDSPFALELLHGNVDARQPIVASSLRPLATVRQAFRACSGYAESRAQLSIGQKPSFHVICPYPVGISGVVPRGIFGDISRGLPGDSSRWD